MSSRVQDQLPALLALAHDRSESARMQLADKLADIFLAEGISLNDREELLLNELIDLLLKTNNATVRAELAKKFANSQNMPRHLALSLVKDAADVAGPILKTSQSLTDDDLIEVIETLSMDHACAIAQRQIIAEAVADALVTTGDIKVMQLVAENMGAKLSNKAIAVLEEAARLTIALQHPVANRPELTAEMATRLYWWLSQDLRRYVLQRFGIMSGQIDSALAKTIEDKLNEHVLDKADNQAMIAVANWLDAHKLVTSKILPQTLRMGHFRLFNILLSRISHLDMTSIDIIVGETGGRTLAAVCRAININKSNFVSIFLLSRGARADEQIVHPRELSHALMAFDRLSMESARDLLHSWRQKPEYLLRQNEDMVALEA